MYLPGWDPSEEDYANTTIDLSHAAIAQLRRRRRWRSGSVDRLRHVHLTDGTGSAKDEHLVPGRGVDGRRRCSSGTSPTRTSPAHIVLEINTRRCDTREERERDLARVAGVRPRALRGAPRDEHARGRGPSARRARHPGGDPRRGPRASSPPRASRARRSAAIAADAGVDAALVHHYFGTKDDLFLAALEHPGRPAQVHRPPVVAGGPDGAAERLLTAFLSVWDDPELRPSLLAVVARRCMDPGAQRLLSDGFLPVVIEPVGVALGLDRPELRMPLVASQVIGLILLRYVLEVEPLASMPGEQVVATYAPTLQRYLTGPLP